MFKLMPVQMLLGSSVHLLSVGGMAWQAWFDGEPTFLQIDAWPGRRQFFQDNAAALARETSQPRPWLCLVTIDTSSHFTGLRQARNLHQLLHIHELLRQVMRARCARKIPGIYLQKLLSTHGSSIILHYLQCRLECGRAECIKAIVNKGCLMQTQSCIGRERAPGSRGRANKCLKRTENSSSSSSK